MTLNWPLPTCLEGSGEAMLFLKCASGGLLGVQSFPVSQRDRETERPWLLAGLADLQLRLHPSTPLKINITSVLVDIWYQGHPWSWHGKERNKVSLHLHFIWSQRDIRPEDRWEAKLTLWWVCMDNLRLSWSSQTSGLLWEPQEPSLRAHCCPELQLISSHVTPLRGWHQHLWLQSWEDGCLSIQDVDEKKRNILV